MLAHAMDASAAAYHVGYASRSQFSREYSRLFGGPPRRDVEQIR
jgi:AraC-like DNA-binding protein